MAFRLKNLLLQGGEQRDVLVGRGGDDEINGDGGDDLLFGRGGDDILDGGEGDDQIFGGRGDDTIVGAAGSDRIFGRRGDDLIEGGEGDDRISGNRGDDVIDGGAGDDFISGGRGDDFINYTLGEGADQIRGGRGQDTVALSGDAPVADPGLNLNGGRDRADRRDADSADDISAGDTVDLSGLGFGVRVDLDENNQGVLQAPNDLSRNGLSEFGLITVGAAPGGDVLVDELNDFENVIGTDFNDTILGNAQNNVLIGGDGNDALHPFGGEDFVDGGEGADRLLLNGFGAGSVVDLSGEEDFAVNSTGNNVLVSVENIRGSTVAGDFVRGDDEGGRAADQGVSVDGGAGIGLLEVDGNVLEGLGGDDLLLGGAGNDQLVGGDNVDQPRADAQGDNADVLNGEEGADILTGGAGSDLFGFSFTGADADVVTDFTIADDILAVDISADAFQGVRDREDGVNFVNVARDGDGAESGLVIEDGFAEANVFVLQGEFVGNAGGAARALAAALQAEEAFGEPGVAVENDDVLFVYFNTGQNQNRLFLLRDANEANADSATIELIANLSEGNADESLADADVVRDSLADFSAANFQLDDFQAQGSAFNFEARANEFNDDLFG